MARQKKGTEQNSAPTTMSEYIIIDRISLLFFIIFFVVIIIEQFYPSERLLGFALGMGLSSLFTHCVSMKIDSEIQEFDKGE